jgi:hypothetical protein
MRALLLADLKADSKRLAWLDSQASRFDLIAIAGNFLDVFSPVPLRVQVSQAKSFLQSVALKTSVAFCSGNHDTVDEITPAPRGPIPTWMAQIEDHRSLASDGQTRIVRGAFLVTALSFIATADQKRLWLEIGANMRNKCDLPWLVLHHIPIRSDQIMVHDSMTSEQLIRDYQPTFWFTSSGETASQPRELRWDNHIDKTIVIHPGRSDSANFLNHIALDLQRGVLSRYVSPNRPPDQFAYVLADRSDATRFAVYAK